MRFVLGPLQTTDLVESFRTLPGTNFETNWATIYAVTKLAHKSHPLTVGYLFESQTAAFYFVPKPKTNRKIAFSIFFSLFRLQNGRQKMRNTLSTHKVVRVVTSRPKPRYDLF